MNQHPFAPIDFAEIKHRMDTLQAQISKERFACAVKDMVEKGVDEMCDSTTPRSFARTRKFRFLPSNATVLALRGKIPMLIAPMTAYNLNGGTGEMRFLLDNRWKAVITTNGGILCHVPREKHRVFWEWAKEHKINVEYMQAGAVPKF